MQDICGFENSPNDVTVMSRTNEAEFERFSRFSGVRPFPTIVNKMLPNPREIDCRHDNIGGAHARPGIVTAGHNRSAGSTFDTANPQLDAFTVHVRRDTKQLM